MKTTVLSLVVAGLLTSTAFAAPTPKAAGRFGQGMAASQPDKPVNIDDVSYAFGYTMGSNMKRNDMQLNIDQFISGLKEALAGKEAKQSKEEMMQTLMNYQRTMAKKRVEMQKKAAEENKKLGEEFLAKNKKKDGVVTLPSGLQYKIITKGTGDKPSEGDTVKVTYTGKLVDGEVFASNDDPNNPATFNIRQVIPGWKEALQLMRKGATWELYVPANLAYGARGTRGQIGPNSTLIFRINLLDIEKPSQTEAKKTNNTQSRFNANSRHRSS